MHDHPDRPSCESITANMTYTKDFNMRIKALATFIADNSTQACKALSGLELVSQNGIRKNETQAIAEACRELEALLTEPHEWVAHVAWAYMDSVALSIVLEMKIHRHIQQGDNPTSLAQLAEMTGGSIELISKHETYRLISEKTNSVWQKGQWGNV